jgi:hypothetical protein
MARSRALILVFAAALPFVTCGGGGGGSASTSNSSGSTAPVDTTPPTVTGTNPSDHSIGVAINSSITASFSENITATSPSAAFTLSQGGTPVPGTVTISGATATFAPSQVLGNGLTYMATLSTAIKDLAGNPLGAPFGWSFITSDCNAISLVRQVDLGAVVGNAMFKALATDGTSIYLWTQTDSASTYGTVFKIDPQSGTILSTTNVPLVPMAPSSTPNSIQFVADITWYNNALWASGVYVDATGNFPQGVFRINLATGLAENPIPVSAGPAGEISILQGLASDGTSLYAAIDRNYQPPAATDHVIVKFNPAATTQIPLSPVLLTTPGQATRLDAGGGYLWVFNNPNFQKVDPATGAVLAAYCKTDGGANILFFNQDIWSIKDTVLQAYSLP